MSEIVPSENYALVQYSSLTKARDAYLDAYFGKGACNRETAAQMAGIPMVQVGEWFADLTFYKMLETRLVNNAKRRSSLQSDLLEHSQDVMTSNVMNCFERGADGGLHYIDPKLLPLSVQNSISSIDIARQSVGGSMDGVEWREVMRIKMHDKAKFIQILADYTGLRETIHNSANSGVSQMIGLNVITAAAKQEEITDETGD